MKFCILKPIVWNDNGYKAPCGPISVGNNFINEHGYGHEEWNNTAGMKHEGRAYFHSEAKDALAEKAQGNMCVLLIAAHEGTNYVVGIGAGVTANKKEDMPSIAATLKLYEKWKKIWAVPLVREKFKNNRKDFLKHWKRHYTWIMWSCPENLYHWFPKPIPFNSAQVTKKKRVVSMFSSWQYVSPAIVWDLLDGKLPAKHPIFAWLLDGDFKSDKSTPTDTPASTYYKKKKNHGKRKGGNRPAEMLYEYWVEGKRIVHPRHRTLQDAFVRYLETQGISCEQDTPDYIDIIYKDKNKLVITEIKPAEFVGTKYAIRTAIGQLLEYRYTTSHNALLHIVLDEKPQANEIKFVKSLNILLSYKEAKSGEFITP